MKLVQPRIATNNVSRLSHFNREKAGMKPLVENERYVELSSPQMALAISSQEVLDLYSAGAAIPGANFTMILDFEVEDVDKERERLGRFISNFVLEPTTQPWGNRSMLFRDPDGNLINFFTRLSRNASRE